MIGSAILAKAYRLTNKNASTFLDQNSTNIYEDLNTCYGLRVLDILRVSVDKNATIQSAKTTFPDSSALSEGDNGYNGEEAFPSDLLRPTRFEVSYDGVTWKKATIYDNALNRMSEFNDTQIQKNFSQEFPMVDFARNSYKVRPLNTSGKNIINGLYIEYEKRQADFSSSTSPSEIEPNLQNILAWDLASLEIVMHADKYTPQAISVFNMEKMKVERTFLSFYKKRFNGAKTMNFNFSSIMR